MRERESSGERLWLGMVGNGLDRENGRERERLGEGEGWERGESGDRAVGNGHWEAELLGEPLRKHKI